MRGNPAFSSSVTTKLLLAFGASSLVLATACSSATESTEPAPEPSLASADVDAPTSESSGPSPDTGARTSFGVDRTGGLAGSPTTPADPATPVDPSAPTTPPEPPTPTPPASDPGPKPTKACSITKDANGFFARTGSGATYVGYVPASYTGNEPLPLLVGMHGCGDNAMNFATWAVAPYDTRATQKYIGISLGGETGNNKCWSMGGDDAKVLAAIDDISSCFWVDKNKVVIGGFSSGGQLAYRVGLSHADRFAGALIECSGLYAAGDANALLASAPKKLPIAHRAHTSDTVFPIGQVKADWSKTTAAGFALTTSEVPGGHDGTSADWTGFLLPQMATWTQ